MPATPPELPALFDLDYGTVQADLDLYKNLARRTGGPLLELGVGTGRVAIPLARAGFDVWGIDASEEMLARARCKAGAALAGRLHLSAGDLRAFELGRQFGLIFAALGTFHHLLTPDDQLACLRCVERHLTAGGLFVCDQRPFFHDDWDAASSVPLFHDWTRRLPETGETVLKFRSVRADPARQVKHETHLYDCVSSNGRVRRLVVTVDLRFTNRYEMAGLLREAGLELDRAYGDYDLSPYDETSACLIVVAHKR